MRKADKISAVEGLGGTFNTFPVLVMLHHKGLSVGALDAVRSQAREVGGGFKVTKNRLAKIAIADTPHAILADKFQGQTGVLFGDDVVALSKVAVGIAKEHKNQVELQFCVHDSKLLERADIEKMAKLPSLDQLRGKIVGVLQAPMGKLVRLLNEPPAQLARVLAARGDQS